MTGSLLASLWGAGLAAYITGRIWGLTKRRALAVALAAEVAVASAVLLIEYAARQSCTVSPVTGVASTADSLGRGSFRVGGGRSATVSPASALLEGRAERSPL